jgi:hypothetical protein
MLSMMRGKRDRLVTERERLIAHRMRSLSLSLSTSIAAAARLFAEITTTGTCECVCVIDERPVTECGSRQAGSVALAGFLSHKKLERKRIFHSIDSAQPAPLFSCMSRVPFAFSLSLSPLSRSIRVPYSSHLISLSHLN